MVTNARAEETVFSDLASLCRKPGYVHALAYLCFRDNLIFFRGEIKEADIGRAHSPKRLIRTEISTLLGLLVREQIDWRIPSPKALQDFVNSSDQLLAELHGCLSGEFFAGLTREDVERGVNPFASGRALREPIFYSGEAAYSFQYLDLAARKYRADAEWLHEHRGFSPEQASSVARAIEEVQNDRLEALRGQLRMLHPDEWSMLPAFTFTSAEVAAKADQAVAVVAAVLDAFALPSAHRNTQFESLQDFNAINATPLIRRPDGSFVSFQSYGVAEALYETPFFWMAQDAKYLPTLNKNRGDFTEDFVAERLRLVFGASHVLQNVDIFESKAGRVAEIDVLVLWANRAIVVQTKSKRLTIPARKGNDQVLQDDFKKSVQAAYDQGSLCAERLLDDRSKLTTREGLAVAVPKDLKEIYLVCAVSDHYPALSFQARQFLKTRSVDLALTPLVVDVFALDAMTEMLQTPLQFLSFLNRRALYGERLMASQELTILGYHLKKNLWIDPGVSLMQLEDDFTVGLDVAMAVRRTGVQGAATPDGVLTRFSECPIGRIVSEIEQRADSATIDLGFLLLSLSEQAVDEMSRVVDRLASMTRADGTRHDATFAFNDGVGITFHCSDDPPTRAMKELQSYCERRKYKEKASTWFGLCLSSTGPAVRFGVTLTYPWAYDAAMDVDTRTMQAPKPIDEVLRKFFGARRTEKRVGRNDPCPCGSGRKFKKCCLA